MNPADTANCTSGAFTLARQLDIKTGQIVRLSTPGTSITGRVHQVQTLSQRRITVDIIATDASGRIVGTRHPSIRLNVSDEEWVVEIQTPTPQQAFDKLPIGAIFDLSDDQVARVKVNTTEFYFPLSGTVVSKTVISPSVRLKRLSRPSSPNDF